MELSVVDPMVLFRGIALALQEYFVFLVVFLGLSLSWQVHQSITRLEVYISIINYRELDYS